MLEALLLLAAAVADAFRPRWALLTEIAFIELATRKVVLAATTRRRHGSHSSFVTRRTQVRRHGS
jgi:hypothetical protein